jgi:hypothetical protein
MAQPTTASISHSTSVQQAAAAIVRRINEKPTTPTVEEIAALIGKPVGQGDFAPTISGVAQEINRLWRLRDILDQRRPWTGEQIAKGEEPIVDYADHLKVADARRDLMEELLLGLEPESIDEVLSLLLIMADALDDFANAHTNLEEADDDLVDLNRAIYAMVRGLINIAGARSPVLDHYYPSGCLTPPAEEIADALTQSREIAEAGEAAGGSRP